LTGQVTAALQRRPEIADLALTRLERACVLPELVMHSDSVHMHSKVGFEFDESHQRGVQLVFPREEDIGSGKVSVLTIGTALIGSSPGRS